MCSTTRSWVSKIERAYASFFEVPALAFWGERRLSAPPPIEFINRPDNLDDPKSPSSSSDSDGAGSPAPSD